VAEIKTELINFLKEHGKEIAGSVSKQFKEEAMNYASGKIKGFFLPDA